MALSLRFFWSALSGIAGASTIVQILLFLPLTLVTLSANAFLLLSLLYLIHSLIHGSLLLFWGNPALPFLQTPTHIFLLLVSFNLLSQELSPWLTLAADWWGKVLRFSSPGFIIIECLSSLVVAQQLGRAGKNLVEEREGAQFGLLIASAVAYVASAVSIVWSYPTAADSPLTSTLLGVALTAFVFLTFIGFGLRRTNIIESSGLALFLAYNFWLCGFDSESFTNPSSAYAAPPLLGNIKILPSIQNLINFITNTLPKPVLVALVYRLVVLNLAFQILPTIGADSWETEAGVDDSWGDRPTSALAHLLLTYRQSIMIMVYSHLLLLDYSSHVWWRWMSVFFTLFLWAVELTVSNDGEDSLKVE